MKAIAFLCRVAILALLAVLIGCAAPKPAESERNAHAAVGEAVAGVAGIEAHTESATRAVEAAKPHTDEPGKPYLETAQAEHKAILDDTAKVKSDLADAQAKVTKLGEDAANLQKSLDALNARWFVRWGLWIEHILTMIVIGWALLGLVSIILGIGNPIGWPMAISKEIVRLLPFANFFAWLRDGGISIRAMLSRKPAVASPVTEAATNG